MPPKPNPLPELIPNRIVKLREMLRGSLWADRQNLTAEISPLREQPGPVGEAAGLDFQPIHPGQNFGEPHGAWQHCWFRVDVPAPTPAQAGRRYFFWDCRGESIAFIDGQPWAGLDVAHPYCILPDRACTLWIDCGTYQTCIWYPGGKPIDEYGLRFDGAWTACRNPQAWETYWDLHVLVEWMTFLLQRDNLSNTVRSWGPFPPVRTAHPVLRKLLGMLDEAFMAWETGGIPALGPALKRIYAAFPAEDWQPKVSMFGHSHLDLVWMWPEAEGERKAIHTIATALRLLEEYPQYRFMWTSPASMKVLAEQAPALLEQVKQKIHEGRWETTGGAWVEFDTLIACGEALGRSLVLGQRAFEKLRGSLSTTVFLPDCFGFNGFLPQIMAQAGIDNFYTTKLSWSAVTEFPYDSFVWRSADGSEVITHLNVTAPAWDSLPGMVEAAYNYRELTANNEILKYTGVGDGGGGTTIDKLELFNRLGNLAQVPKVEWGTVEGYFNRLGEVREKLPVFEGELYLEFHRGIYTTESEFKRRFRRLERALQTWEAARAVRGAGPVPEHYWQRLCFTQFHDAIPGSSIKLVYDQLGAELEQLGSEVLDCAGAELSGSGPAAVFNPLALARRMVVELPQGAQLSGPVQTLSTPEGVKTIASVQLPGLAVCPVESVLANGAVWEVNSRVLDNGLLRVEFDAQGQISRISEGGSAWPLAGAPKLILHPDYPPSFDAWEIDHNATRQSITTLSGMPLQVIERGPVRAVLAGAAGMGDASCVQVRYILEAGSDALKIELDVDWQEEHRLLRYYLPTTVRGRSARYGAPYGSLQRPQVPASPREEAMWEVPASRWAAVCDDTGQDGLAMVTEAKYGFASRDGELALTLLRAPVDPAIEYPDGNPRGQRPDRTPELGQHTLRFAITRYRSHTSGGKLSTPAMAEALYAPAPVVTGSVQPAPFRFLGDLGTLVPTWVLPATDGSGYILRLNETGGASGEIRVAFAQPPTEVAQVDFLEREMSAVKIEQISPVEYNIRYTPYTLASLRVKTK